MPELLCMCMCMCVLALNSPAGSDLKRFSEARLKTAKLSTFVNFPIKELDLCEFASDNSSTYST